MSNMREKIQELAKEYIGDVMCESWVNNLLSLFQSEMERIVKESKPDLVDYDAPISTLTALDQYESNLTQELAKLMEEVKKNG